MHKIVDISLELEYTLGMWKLVSYLPVDNYTSFLKHIFDSFTPLTLISNNFHRFKRSLVRIR